MDGQKTILFISSEAKHPALMLSLIAELKKTGYDVEFIAGSKNSRKMLWDKNIPAGLVVMPKIKNIYTCLLALAALPFRQIAYFLRLAKIKKSSKVRTAILIGLAGKILFTRILKILGFKIYWIEWPNTEFAKMNFLCRLFYAYWLKKIGVLAFTGSTANALTRAFPHARANVLRLSLVPDAYRRQDSIFDNIASRDRSKYHKKFFTVGTVLGSHSQRNLELLFSAIQKSLDSAPNIQLIVIGEIINRRESAWLAKKMGIDSVVWFVGEQKFLGKWLDSFDLFVAIVNDPDLDEIDTVLRAMSFSLPVIAPSGKGFEDFIVPNKNGSLIEMDNSEMLARQIIKLYQDRRLCAFLGQNAKAHIDSFCNYDKMLDSFKAIFEHQGGTHTGQ